MPERISVNTTIDKQLIKKIKLLGVEENKRINDLIEEGLKMVLKSRGQEILSESNIQK